MSKTSTRLQTRQFFILVAVLVVLAGVSVIAYDVYLTRKHSNWITLGDWSAKSVVVATDLDAYRALLGVRPSPAWESYYRDVVTEKDLEQIFSSDPRLFRQLQNSGRIVQLPNGTRAEQTDRVVLTHPDTAVSVVAIKFRVRAGPQKGLLAFTSPYILQHDVAPFF